MGRGSTSAVGICLLILITIFAAATVATIVTASPTAPPPTATFETTVDPERDEITLTHHRGETLDLSETTVQIEIDGEPLQSQPPVPFFAAEGFQSGPTGPFNAASPDQWQVGDTAGFRLASTNKPELTAGDTVTIRIETEAGLVATLTETA